MRSTLRFTLIIPALAFALVFALALIQTGAEARAGTPGDAERLYLEGDWAGAVKEYSSLALDNPSVENLVGLGWSFFYFGSLEAAEEAFRQAGAIEVSADSAIALAMLDAIKDPGKLGEIEKLAKQYGETALLRRATGLALLKAGKTDQALRYFHGAVKKDYKDYMSNFQMGLIFEGRHQCDDAIPVYQKTLKYSPRFAQALNNLGYCYKERRYYRYAIDMYRKAIAVRPNIADYHYNLGNALMHKSMLSEAFKSYSRAVELNPGFAKAHYNLGHVNIEMGQIEEGLKALELYIKYWDESLLKLDAPTPRMVKEEIAQIKHAVSQENGDSR